MISTRRTLKALAALLPLGALAVSTALAGTPVKPVVTPGQETGGQQGVAERLQAIRSAVSEATAEQTGLQPDDPNIQKAWWGNWRPGGGGAWGNGGWRNGGWRNGGWGNGGWGNGGWGNWHNGWHNGGWNNFWRNW